MELVSVVSSSFNPATPSPTVSLFLQLSLSHLDPEIRPGERLVADDSTGSDADRILLLWARRFRSTDMCGSETTLCKYQ